MSKPQLRTRSLQSQLIPELKKPLGKLIRGSSSETEPKVKQFLSKTKPALVIAVGDEVSRLISDMGKGRTVLILDKRTKRTTAAPLELKSSNIYRVKNPAGFIFPEARAIVRKILSTKRSAVVEVEGEEDLLALPAMAYAPLGSIVIYGQPGEGVVVSVVDEDRRKFARRFMRRMAITR